jgi:cyanophycinase
MIELKRWESGSEGGNGDRTRWGFGRRLGGRGLLILAAAAVVVDSRVALGADGFTATAVPDSASGPEDDPPTTNAAASRSVVSGSLVICGGGRVPRAVREEFWKRAGGPRARIVVVPTASELADAPGTEDVLAPWVELGAESVVLLHTRSRERANDPAFAEPLLQASGVWFGGGDQSRITEVYLGTACERGFRGVLERNGVLGGTSAGAAIMSLVMITGGGETATTDTGFGFLPGVVVDQHALRRNRLNRLLGVIRNRPELGGVAVDESTALVVDQTGWRVVGESYVVVCRAGGAAHVRLDVYCDGDRGPLERLWPEP